MLRTTLTAFAAALALGIGLTAQAAPKPRAVYLEPRKAIPAPAGAVRLCQQLSWACQKDATGPARNESIMTLARQINRKINRRVRAIEDSRQYGQEEVWALPTARGGDCEDFALLKKRELIKAGVRAQDLLIATALDRQRGSHAVLILRTAQGDMVLDNLTDRILRWDQTGYSFIAMQNPDRPSTWVAVLAGGIFS
ncbi:putative transglutaminase-like cysteine proteinase [Albidovulum inexpectatum]|uniref:Putative transglutaminase-like cysteine proteinase n=1 Tax=Albidovulum inexpectatum TaxID=196587 RepID=A0A2S5JJ97_9RHOB|nr:transglutaminase-like cysteine peptidase [Albidovulum inexpectatum]PPB81586.1 putative transglutaminase-like cysteine proteinase [Albidovulum inexpectatum]